jgi:hypothetical protein
MSSEHSAGQNHSLEIGNKSFENLATNRWRQRQEIEEIR